LDAKLARLCTVCTDYGVEELTALVPTIRALRAHVLIEAATTSPLASEA